MKGSPEIGCCEFIGGIIGGGITGRYLLLLACLALFRAEMFGVDKVDSGDGEGNGGKGDKLVEKGAVWIFEECGGKNSGNFGVFGELIVDWVLDDEFEYVSSNAAML